MRLKMRRIFVSQDASRNSRNIINLERKLDEEVTPCHNNFFCTLRLLRGKEICYSNEARRCRAYKILNYQ